MKKFFKKVLSCAIALTLVAVSAAAFKAMPAKAASSVTIYFNNTTTKWSNVYCYMYYGSGDNGPSWPGTKMNDLGNGWFSITYTGTNPIDPVFNDNNGNQTNNCTEMDTSNSSVYYVPGNQKVNDMSHSIAYDLNVYTDATQAGYPAGVTIYFDNTTAKWSNVYCYMYYGSGDNGPSWPGTKMTDLGNGWFSFTYTGTKPIDPVFNDNNGNQTNNCTEMDTSSKELYYVTSGQKVNDMSHTVAYDLTIYSDPVKAGYPVTNISSSSSNTGSSSKAATSSTSSTSSAAATSSESSVANPKTGATTPIAAGSVVVLASVAVLGIALAKKKSK